MSQIERFPRFEELEAFVSLSSRLSFTDAADDLDTSQAVLSRQIQQLEISLGQKLVNRTTRSVQLTEAGASFLPSARRMLAELERSHRQLVNAEYGPMESIRLGYVSSAAVSLLPKLMRKYRRTINATRFGLYEGFDDELIAALRTDDIDVALIRSSNVRSDIAITPVGDRDAICAVVPAEHELAVMPKVSIETMRSHGIVIWPRALDAIDRNVLESAFSRAGFDVTFEQPNISAVTVLGLAAIGAGIGMLAEPFSKLRWPGVKFVPIEGRWSQLHLACRQDSSTNIRTFVETVGNLD